MTESKILYDVDGWYIVAEMVTRPATGESVKAYSVYKPSATHAVRDSAYEFNADGFALAQVRAYYGAKRGKLRA
jgi:hypothetical protein